MVACFALSFVAALAMVATGQEAMTGSASSSMASPPRFANRAALGRAAPMAASMPMPEMASGMAFAGGAAASSDMMMASEDGFAGDAQPMRMSKMAAGGMAGVVSAMSAASDSVGQQSGGDAPLTGPVVLKSASMNVETKDVGSVMAAIQAAVEALGGFVESAGSSTDEWLLGRYRAAGAEPPSGPTHGHMQLRVPAAKLDNARAAVQSAASASTAGRVTGESSHGQDVTGQYVDTVARQRVQEKSLAALEELLKASNSVQDVLSVKREMDMVVANLEGSKAQRKNMESRAALSTLSLSLSVPQPPERTPPAPPGWTASSTFAQALKALGKAGQDAATVGIYTAVFALPMTLVGLLLVQTWKRAVEPLVGGLLSGLVAKASAARAGGAAQAAAGAAGGSRQQEGYVPLRSE